MTIQSISPALLAEMPKEVIAIAYAASRVGGHAVADNIDDAIRTEWATGYVRGYIDLEPPFPVSDYFIEHPPE